MFMPQKWLQGRAWLVGKKPKSRWGWFLGIATGVAGAGVILLRGCWHGKMSWPVRAHEHSYQVCLGCGIKRLFDEQSFRAIGPYSYDLNQLIAWDAVQRKTAEPLVIPAQERSAS
jgi:hypothetical protein